MASVIWLLIGGLGVMLSWFSFQIWNKPTLLKEPDPKKSARPTSNYIFGILSSRSHFEQREAVRQTWLQHKLFKEKNNIFAKFIVGSHPCYIPPQDRQDEYGCELWDVHRVANEKVEYFSHQEISKTETKKQHLFHGFGFKVNHPIVVDKLGVLSIFNTSSRIKVILEDAFTETVVLKTELSTDSPGVQLEGFLYRPVKPYILPKGFEGKLFVSDVDLNNEIHGSQMWNDGGHLITFTQILSNSNTVHKYINIYSSAVSFGFRIYDAASLNRHVADRQQRKQNWNEYLKIEEKKLKQEALHQTDILFVDIIDVYRHLPLKLLKFYEWIHENYLIKAVIKTDDDCMLDVDKITAALENSESQTYSDKFVWWSRFRYNWMVDRIGKWRELDYTTAVYPPFACGSGNVVSRLIVEWIANNSRYLHSYQGEDVSMGIWLSALNPDLINDFGWNCEKTCIQGSYNYGELKPEQMKSAWQDLQKCGNICGCEMSDNQELHK